ncbi:hypothetical protein E6H25_06740 [Candidatus Bathyarchaeota archaeon]|nr:MAG: hypothetical protein E6H25_06740 [Candidatus Bathyarchaeota archaeon]
MLGLVGFEVVVLAILAFFLHLPDPGLATLNKGICTFLAPLSTVLPFGLLYAWLARLGTREARSHATGKETRASLYRPDSSLRSLSIPW